MINPANGSPGDTIIITGENFSGATEVRFGGATAASFTVVSSTEISAVIGKGSKGSVSVTTPSGTISNSAFIFISIPSISSFVPASGITGTIVSIKGTNLNGVTAVSFGGTAADSYTFVSPTEILGIVGVGATGEISVTTTGQTATISGFIFGPQITDFTPLSASQGTSITITGENLSAVTFVSFGGTAASSFTVVSSTQISAVVGSGSSGKVSLTSKYGTATLAGFTYK